MLRALYEWLHPAAPAEAPSADTSDAAQKAIMAAQADLRDAYKRRPQVEELVSVAEMQLARNGFGAMVTRSMEKRTA